MSEELQDHPRERALREARRGSPQALARLRGQIESILGVRVDTDLLSPDQCHELTQLTERAVEPEPWQQTGQQLFRPTRLTRPELQRWRQLVGIGCGNEALLDELDEDGRVTERLRALAARAMTPAPTKYTAAPGSVPAAAWQAVYDGELHGVDLLVLSCVAYIFATGRLHPQVERRRDGVWTVDDTLVIRRGLNALLPQWGAATGYGGDPIGADRQGIEDRLAAGGWLELERHGPAEVAVRLGPRFSKGDAR